jgi:hypothetical protein
MRRRDLVDFRARHDYSGCRLYPTPADGERNEIDPGSGKDPARTVVAGARNQEAPGPPADAPAFVAPVSWPLLVV